MADLLVRLEQASIENAHAFVVVATDTYSGAVLNSTGPFEQAEQALAETGRLDAEWRRTAEDEVEADAISYIVVPLWEPAR